MDFLTFVTSLVESLAWPAVVIFFLWKFHEKIDRVLSRLIRLKHKDTELEFKEGIDELKYEVVLTQESDATKIEAVRSDQYGELIKLTKISPRSAVVEAWLKVESAAARATMKAYPELTPNMLRGPGMPLNFLKDKILSQKEMNQLYELRRLRNLVAHDVEFELGGEPIEAYINIAISLAEKLNAYEP